MKRINRQWEAGPTKSSFKNQFEKYKGMIVSERELRRAWHEFEETIVMPESDTESEIMNTSDASSYFNHATVVSPNVSFNYYRSVPNLLTGMGILGTFLGLAAGVSAASTGLSSSTPSEITTSLNQLLKGSSLAFLTSIAGILCSLISVLVNAGVSKHLDEILAQFVDNIEEKLTRITSASVAMAHLKEAKQTTNELKTFNTQLVFSIRQALEESFAKRLSPQLKELLEAVESLRGDRATDSANVIAKMTENFASVLREQAGNQFEKLGETVEDLGNMLRQSTQALAETQEKVRETMATNSARVAENLAETGERIVSDITTQLERALGGLGNATADQFQQINSSIQNLDRMVNDFKSNMSVSQAKTQEFIENSTTAMVSSVTNVTEQSVSNLTATVEDSVGELRSATTQLISAMNSTASMINSMQLLVDNFDDLSKVIENTHHQISKTASPIREGSLAIEQATIKQTELLSRSDESLTEMQNSFDKLREYGEVVSRTWEEYCDRFGDIDDSLKNVFENLDAGLKQYAETIHEFVQELDKTSGSCISKLATANSELTVAVEELRDTFEEYRR